MADDKPISLAEAKQRREQARRTETSQPTDAFDDGAKDEELPREAQPRQRDLLIKCADDADLWHDADEIGYATIQARGHRENHYIRSKTFRGWLGHRYYKQYGGAPGAQAVEDALRLIEVRARYERPLFEATVRLGQHGDAIYLDLGDENWRAIEITTKGWHLLDGPPVKFIRPRGMRPLPVPAPGGSVVELRPFVNVASDQDFTLVLAWLVAAMRPTGPYPILILGGEQGAAKSTVARALRSLVDPNIAPIRTAPREERDLLIAARNGWIIALDNLSRVQPWLADGLCRIATGGGFGARQLYSDADEMLFEAQRPAILNGIPDLATRPDLADRSLVLTLPQISDDSRLPETAFWNAFEEAKPRILGALLDAVSTALRHLPTVDLPRTPRMADFAIWATAAEPALKLDHGAFMQAYVSNLKVAVEMTVEADVIATAIRDLAQAKGSWAGTATELLSVLNECTSEGIRRQKEWPTDATRLSGRLRRAAAALRKADKLAVDIVISRRQGRSHINIRIVPQNSSSSATSSTRTKKFNDLGGGAEVALGGAGGATGGADDDLSATKPETSNSLKNNDSAEGGGASGAGGADLQPNSSWEQEL